MADNHIHVDVDARRAEIRRQVTALAASLDGSIPPEELDESDPSSLLHEVTHMVEMPTALLGQFEAEYLELPREVLITAMKKHQRYFPVVDATSGELLPYFVTVRNGDEAHLDLVRQGNEDVLRARYADARFFYESDTKQDLAAYLPRLDTLTFQEQLGSMLDKVHRLEKLVAEIAPWLNLDPADQAAAARAAHLAKADLATNLVVEFTSLQGIMGRHYALLCGEDEAVADAIFEHYLPRFAGDALPHTLPGIAVNIADRLDSLVGLFAVGMAPTGSADPFALRRDALALVQILIGRQIPFSLAPALVAAAALQPVSVDENVLEQVLDFVRERLRGWLRSELESPLSHDVVDAVLAERGDDPFMAYRTARQLAAWVDRDDWMDLLNAYGRCIRIVRPEPERYEVDPAHLVEPAEMALWEATKHAQAQVTPASSADRLLTALRPMIPAINRFFDDVLVMHEEEHLRHNRVGLLQAIWDLSRGILDVTRLEGF